MFQTHQEKLLFKPIAALLELLYPCFDSRNLFEFPDCSSLNQQLNQLNANDKVLQFIPQHDDMPFANLGYEQRIFLHGKIATRSQNWHDFFNSLAWITFPKAKSALNAIHYKEILKQDSNLRSRKRDLLTLFDECGVVVMADNFILDLIRSHQWQALFVDNKQLWLDGKIKLVTFGHALYEKYLNPYIGMTAQALLLNINHQDIDEFLSKNLLSKTVLQSKAELSPLPLLGIPNWYKKQDEAFYSNKNYFR